MRFFLRLAFWFILIFPQQLPAQSPDSLATVMDTGARAINPAERDIQRWKDSLEKEKIFRQLEENGQSLADYLQEMRQQEEKRKRQITIRIGLGVLFLVVVVVGLLRRRK